MTDLKTLQFALLRHNECRFGSPERTELELTRVYLPKMDCVSPMPRRNFFSGSVSFYGDSRAR